jgi:hypothetical protein
MVLADEHEWVRTISAHGVDFLSTGSARRLDEVLVRLALKSAE